MHIIQIQGFGIQAHLMHRHTAILRGSLPRGHIGIMIQRTDNNFIARLPRLTQRTRKAKHQIGRSRTKDDILSLRIK